MKSNIFDITAIGIGPFNLSLACLTDPMKDLNTLFLDKREKFDWHPGMLLQDSTLQIPFLADLVTLADPTSPYSFLNYIKQQERIYAFYIRENFFLLRNEYNQYCQWATKQLSNLRFGEEVREVRYDEGQQCYQVAVSCSSTGKMNTHATKKLVLGTGTIPYTPKGCIPVQHKAVHSSRYLSHKKELQRKKSITILGSGQSAAEIYYDLLQDIDLYHYELHWITRSPRFFPLEYSKLTLEMTSPDYVDYFYALPYRKKQELLSQQKHLYKGINNDLIANIYDLLYTKRLTGPVKTSLLTNSECLDSRYSHDGFRLSLYHREQEKHFDFTTEALVTATGYEYRTPGFLEPIAHRIRWTPEGRFDVHRNYATDHNANEIFVQNAELHTHGFVTPDLGMGCYRNACIINAITGETRYPVEDRIAFQQFGAIEENMNIPAYEEFNR